MYFVIQQDNEILLVLFLFYDFYFKFYLLSVLYIHYSTKRLFIHYDLLLQQHFFSQICFFMFTIVFYEK